MASTEPIFTKEIFTFFKQLSRNNSKAWMDANRERYQSAVVQPFRKLLEELSPAALKLNSSFDISGRSGANFSRINRDIRFAKDKTPYRPQMYLYFTTPAPGEGESGQLYVGISADAVTAGYRIYSGGKRKASTLAMIAEPRALRQPGWVAKQKKRLGRRYDSYWYSMEKGEWTKHNGWPDSEEEWKRILGWIVRRKFAPASATRASFPGEVAKVYKDLYPILQFTSLPD